MVNRVFLFAGKFRDIQFQRYRQNDFLLANWDDTGRGAVHTGTVIVLLSTVLSFRFSSKSSLLWKNILGNLLSGIYIELH